MSAAHRAWLVVLLGLTLVHGLIYAITIPPWQAPDETGHFEYAWLLARLGRIPTANDVSIDFERELLASLYEWHYGEFIDRPLPEDMPSRMNDLPTQILARRPRTVLTKRFSLSYLWQALFLRPFRGQSLLVQLYAARFSSVVLNVLIVLVAFLTFATILPSSLPLAATITAALVFWPQHTFINSAVGEGPLAELMACLVIYCWITLFYRSAKRWAFIGIVLGTVCGIWTKATAAFLVLLNAGLITWWGLRSIWRSWRRHYLVWIAVALVIVIFAGILLVRAPSGKRLVRSVKRAMTLSDWTWVDETGMTLDEGLLRTYDSFWADFGWMVLPTSPRWYGAIAACSILALVGWLTKSETEHRVPTWALIVLGGGLLTAFLAFTFEGMLLKARYWVQGRYLFPASIPYAFFLVAGLDRILTRRAILAVLFLLICFDTWCLAGYIFPYFYA
ncbi:MAG: hypothetical protein JXA89_08035 [Anaerolineae bacterium]|nr:hypothetical protein [Anaerolineae bacterium]